MEKIAQYPNAAVDMRTWGNVLATIGTATVAEKEAELARLDARACDGISDRICREILVEVIEFQIKAEKDKQHAA